MLEFKVIACNMCNQVRIEEMVSSAFMYSCTFVSYNTGFLSFDRDLIFYKTCWIFYISLNIINHNKTHCQ